MEGAERSQIMRFKYKEIVTRDKKGQQPFKKFRGKQPEKYRRGATVKIGSANPYERCILGRIV